jgi:hypothetical protein
MSPPQGRRDLQDISTWLPIQMGWWRDTDVEPMTVRRLHTEAHIFTNASMCFPCRSTAPSSHGGHSDAGGALFAQIRADMAKQIPEI